MNTSQKYPRPLLAAMSFTFSLLGASSSVLAQSYEGWADTAAPNLTVNQHLSQRASQHTRPASSTAATGDFGRASQFTGSQSMQAYSFGYAPVLPPARFAYIAPPSSPISSISVLDDDIAITIDDASILYENPGITVESGVGITVEF